MLVEQTTASWEFWYGLLQRFITQAQHSDVPRSFITDDGHRLGQWVNNQRAKYGRGQLTQEQVQHLEALAGWVWDEKAAQWEDGLRHLVLFVERERHANVPAKQLAGTM